MAHSKNVLFTIGTFHPRSNLNQLILSLSEFGGFSSDVASKLIGNSPWYFVIYSMLSLWWNAQKNQIFPNSRMTGVFAIIAIRFYTTKLQNTCNVSNKTLPNFSHNCSIIQWYCVAFSIGYKNINMFKATRPPSAILVWSRLNGVKLLAKVKDNTIPITTRWEIFEQFLFTFV